MIRTYSVANYPAGFPQHRIGRSTHGRFHGHRDGRNAHHVVRRVTRRLVPQRPIPVRVQQQERVHENGQGLEQAGVRNGGSVPAGMVELFAVGAVPVVDRVVLLLLSDVKLFPRIFFDLS